MTYRALFFAWRRYPQLTERLREIFAQKCEVVQFDLEFGDALKAEEVREHSPDLIFNFAPVILSADILQAARVAAINFHTGPPKWPGRGSCSFALYEGDREFGSTAHVMVERVDAGPIIEVVRFPTVEGDTVESLHKRTLASIPLLAEKVMRNLQENDWKPRPSGERWSRRAMTQRDLFALMEVGYSDDPSEVQRKIRAFAHSTKPGPYVVLGGQKFWYLSGGST